jgi:hypothetical protein
MLVRIEAPSDGEDVVIRAGEESAVAENDQTQNLVLFHQQSKAIYKITQLHNYKITQFERRS